MPGQRAARITDIPPGSIKRVEVNGTPICLARTDDGTVYAIGDICTHEQSSLSEGFLEGMEVECPTHSSRFDVRTGAVTGAPATEPVDSHLVQLVGEDIYVLV